jgi:hypothetical protein
VLDPILRLCGDDVCYDTCSSVSMRQTGGSSPSTVGSSSKIGASSSFPWMKRMFGKKELGVVLRAPSISFEGRMVGMVVSGAFGLTLDQRHMLLFAE